MGVEVYGRNAIDTKNIIEKCINALRQLFWQTQIMEPMIEMSDQRVPEITDVANGVLDGADHANRGNFEVGKNPTKGGTNDK